MDDELITADVAPAGLPSSGTIKFSQIKAEFNKGNNLRAYLGAASGVPSSGTLKMSHFYGKSKPPPPVEGPHYSASTPRYYWNSSLNYFEVWWNEQYMFQVTTSNAPNVTSHSHGGYTYFRGNKVSQNKCYVSRQANSRLVEKIADRRSASQEVATQEIEE